MRFGSVRKLRPWARHDVLLTCDKFQPCALNHVCLAALFCAGSPWERAHSKRALRTHQSCVTGPCSLWGLTYSVLLLTAKSMSRCIVTTGTPNPRPTSWRTFSLLYFLLQISRVLFSLPKNFNYPLPQIYLIAYFSVLAPETIMPWAMKAQPPRQGKGKSSQ